MTEEERMSLAMKYVYLYVVEGAAVVILNVPLTIAMIALRKIRCRREFQVIIGLCITDATFGAAFLFSGVLRYPLVHDISLSGIPLVSRSDCTKRFFVQLLTICYQMQGILSFIVALDRLLAVIFPVKYLKFGNFYNVLIIAAPCVIVLIPTVVNLVLTLNDDSPVSALCLTKEALNPGFHDYMLLMRIISCIGSGMVYGYIALRLKQHFAKHGIQVMGNVKVETNQLRNIRHSTITVGLTTINALVFLLIPDLLALFDLGGFYDNYPTILYSFYCINVSSTKIEARTK
ncbi:hypothetical protein Q1695_006606 [Nippostrongylus brasiliensis]|nr:hypothetical protein Q1695_006606 [Nippostrongylus brasiliensis]